MCHRVREAMKDKGFFQPIKGTVEADETYVGGRAWREQVQDEIKMSLREKPRHWKKDKAIVFGMVKRGVKVKAIGAS